MMGQPTVGIAVGGPMGPPPGGMYPPGQGMMPPPQGYPMGPPMGPPPNMMPPPGGVGVQMHGGGVQHF